MSRITSSSWGSLWNRIFLQVQFRVSIHLSFHMSPGRRYSTLKLHRKRTLKSASFIMKQSRRSLHYVPPVELHRSWSWDSSPGWCRLVLCCSSSFRPACSGACEAGRDINSCETCRGGGTRRPASTTFQAIDGATWQKFLSQQNQYLWQELLQRYIKCMWPNKYQQEDTLTRGATTSRYWERSEGSSISLVNLWSLFPWIQPPHKFHCINLHPAFPLPHNTHWRLLTTLLSWCV